MNLFVLVATGEKVANLPPVLEHAQPGDHVVWLESREARRGRWAEAPLAVLEGFGLVTAARVPVEGSLNDPSVVAAALGGVADTGGQYGTVYLVANGGQKLTPFGLVAAYRAFRPKVLYGDVRPAAWSLYEDGFDAPPVVEPYRWHRLDLPHILLLNGRTFATGSEHRRVWPDAEPPEWSSERYGIDGPYSAELHASHYDRANSSAAGERVPFDLLQSLVPNALARWQRSLAELRRAFNPQTLTTAYHATLKLDESARTAAARGAVPKPMAALGPALEVAVARRVRAWAVATRHPAVRSVWVGVKVASETTPHTSEQEWDVLLVLTNGVLIHLECKSAEIDIRDLDGRTLRLREAGSSLARTACVIPLFTASAAAPWFAALHRQRDRARDGGQTVLDFTLPDQPPQYPVPDTDPPAEAECLPFETALDRWLSAYAFTGGRPVAE